MQTPPSFPPSSLPPSSSSNLRKQIHVHTDEVEGPFLLQDFPRFLRLDPVHDMSNVEEDGGKGGVEECPVYGNDAR